MHGTKIKKLLLTFTILS